MPPEDLRLDAAQAAAARLVLERESAARRHLVVSISGAHAYGFPSPDSDVDVKCVHVAPTAALVGLHPPQASVQRLENVGGIEIDYGSNEVSQVIRALVKGDGNLSERVLSGWILEGSSDLEDLIPLARRALSRKLHAHYRGFAAAQRHGLGEDAAVPVKRVLYVLRVALTGCHALLTGDIVTDLTELAAAHGAGEIDELIERKTKGERALLLPGEWDTWKERTDAAFAALEAARERSPLPEHCPNEAELDAWLVDLRKRSW